MPKPNAIGWFEPARKSREHFLLETAKTGVFGARFWLRVALWSVVIGGGIVGWTTSAFPTATIPWLRVFGVVPMVIFMLLVYVVLYSLCPRHVQVRGDWIQVTHGNHAVRVPRERIPGVRLDDIEVPAKLTIQYRTRRGGSKESVVYVRASVDLSALRDALLAYPTLFSDDAQARTVEPDRMG